MKVKKYKLDCKSLNMPTDAEKREILNDGFVYEVQMVALPAVIRDSIVRSKIEGQIVNNMHIESAVLHTRVLLEFFRIARRYPNDAIASDFLRVGETWTEIDFTNYPNLQQVKDRANEEVAHLSYGRVMQAKSKWKLNVLLIELFEIVDVFVSKCDEKYVGNELRSLMNDLNRWVFLLKKK